MRLDRCQNVFVLPAEDLYARLHAKWGPQHWWPAETPFEVVIGAILTQNTAWRNVERAIEALRSENLLEPMAMSSTSSARLAELIVPAGCYNLKAIRIHNFLRMLNDGFAGDLDRLFLLETMRLRSTLLSVNGIGPETADSILLYAAARPVFVVDAYTRRFLLRHAWIDGGEKYDEIAAIFTGYLPADVQVYSDLHALIVKLGKLHCRRKAECQLCPLNVYPLREGLLDV